MYVGDIIRIREVAKYLPPAKPPGERLLDAGSGQNIYKELVEGKGYKWYGMDINPRPPATYGDVTEIPFEDEFFEVILCVDVLEHVEKDYVAIKEMFRVLKPKGSLVLHTPNSLQTHILADFPENPNHIRKGYTKEQLEFLSSAAGFSGVDIHSTFNLLECILWELANLKQVDYAMMERAINFDVNEYKNLGWLCVARKL